jgi:hypothetical protein
MIAPETSWISDGRRIAEEAWEGMAGPLDLPPDAYPQPVYIRLVPLAQWPGPAPYTNTQSEGAVLTWVGWNPKQADLKMLRRAIVQGILVRQAIALHGPVAGLKVPLWLEDACVAWCLTRAHPAMLESWQQETVQLDPPKLRTLLDRERGGAPDRAAELAALWLISHLRAESGPEGRWPRLVSAVLGGMDSGVALDKFYGSYYSDPAGRELWWGVGFFSQRRASVATTSQTAPDSRTWLSEQARWTGTRGEREVSLTLDDIYQARQESWVRQQLDLRVRILLAGLDSVHPFYHSAAIALGQVYQAAAAGNERDFARAKADLRAAIADGLEMEQAANKLLDAVSAPAASAQAASALPAK